MADTDSSKIQLAANLTAAWLSNPNTRANNDDATSFLDAIHSKLGQLSGGESATPVSSAAGDNAASEYVPAVTVRKSLASKDKIISMVDGKAYTTLKRHLASHGLTPAQYRERYGLKPDYPMTAASYSAKRSAMAKKIGLGAKRGAQKAASTAMPGTTTAKRTRRAAAKPAAKAAVTTAAPAKARRGRKPKAQA